MVLLLIVMASNIIQFICNSYEYSTWYTVSVRVAPGGCVHSGRHGDRSGGGAHTGAPLRRLCRPPPPGRVAPFFDRQSVLDGTRLQSGHRCCAGTRARTFSVQISIWMLMLRTQFDDLYWPFFFRFLEEWGIVLILLSRCSSEIPKFSRYYSLRW